MPGSPCADRPGRQDGCRGRGGRRSGQKISGSSAPAQRAAGRSGSWATGSPRAAGMAVFRRFGRAARAESEWASQNGRGKALELRRFHARRISLTGCTAGRARGRSRPARGRAPLRSARPGPSLSRTASAKSVKSCPRGLASPQIDFAQPYPRVRVGAKLLRPSRGWGTGRRDAQVSTTGQRAARNPALVMVDLRVWVRDLPGPARKVSTKRRG